MNIPAWGKIADSVLAHNYCCGCGVCAGVCHSSVLEMRFNEYGEYRPYLTGKCTNCKLCSKVCPFVDGNANEDELSEMVFACDPKIKHSLETGYYLDAYVGYVADPQVRWNSASGGMATWFLEKLLAEKTVDYVLCVSPNDDPNRLFRYTVCTSTEDIRKCSSSCYYPVTTQEVLSFVAENNGRYAIVGLPCVCKAVRLAQQQSTQLRDRIKYVIGLVCGQTKSKSFVEYICAVAGGDPHKLQKVEFRVKNMSRPASDYGLRFTCEAGSVLTREATIFWTQGMNRAWVDRYFTPQACDFCDDVFAECADIVFMDAWLSEYTKDPMGHSLVLTRKSPVNDFFSYEVENPLQTFLHRISVDSVIRSQLGVLCSKRGGMRDRISFKRSNGLPAPLKRWNTTALIRPLRMWRLNTSLHRVSRKTGVVWADVDKNLDAFLSGMKDLLLNLDKAKRQLLFYRLPNAVLRKGGMYKKWAMTNFYS